MKQCLQSRYTTTVIGSKGSHQPSKLRVAGSIPAGPTTFNATVTPVLPMCYHAVAADRIAGMPALGLHLPWLSTCYRTQLSMASFYEF